MSLQTEEQTKDLFAENQTESSTWSQWSITLKPVVEFRLKGHEGHPIVIEQNSKVSSIIGKFKCLISKKGKRRAWVESLGWRFCLSKVTKIIFSIDVDSPFINLLP
jgi:hypothetical protein